MASRTVSLPDLVAERKRNTALSLSEGFAGARHDGALNATAQNWAPKPVGFAKGTDPEGGMANFTGLSDESAGQGLARILPIYYRTRQLVLGTEKGGHRVPAKLASELRNQEKAVGREIRALHPLLFQRFDDTQLDRLLRAMPFLRLSSGRWLFGSAELNAAWPAKEGVRSFLLLSGKIALYQDPNGAGDRSEIFRGCIFGEKKFRLCDEKMADVTAAAAHCEEPCIVAILSSEVLEAAYADRAFGNRRIAQLVRHVPSFSRVVLPDSEGMSKKDFEKMTMAQKSQMFEEKQSGSVKHALTELSQVSTAIHIIPGNQLLTEESLDASVITVSKGSIEIRADVILSEKLDALPPKKVRIRVYVEKAEQLAGGSLFDKLDPYCIVKLGDFKRFQTPVLWNVGSDPRFDYHGVLTFAKEELMEITVMDHDKFSADDLCGSCSLEVADLYDGYAGWVYLTRPKKGVLKENEALEESAGKVFIRISYDYEKVSSLTRTPKERTWEDQVLFVLKEKEAWGHEQLMLGTVFKKTLEGASNSLPFQLRLENFRIVGGMQRGANDIITVWKASKNRFLDFVAKTQRGKQFMQGCRGTALEKQAVIKAMIRRLIEKWEAEEQATLMRKGIFSKSEVEEEIMDPSKFRVAYRGTRAHVTVRAALNLSGGGWFDKLDPYAILRFRGSKQEMRTSVLQDAGSDPVWNCEGTLTYGGEVALEVSVWDYDRYSADDLIATGIIQVEQFCHGFEGMVPLSLPGDKKKKSLKQSMIVIGIIWDTPRNDPSRPGALGDAAASATFTSNISGLKQLQ
eukprot:TRINITY_DN67853_c0_g1_i1.p1 TRINITY_DN67853_c0_g1~~TRINITY_DN67853_c0_g1_i1.p1  ORF type:complete len:798 (+),score=162.36 TRINITY_DN67853_c0_g1_i1:120-2513(+)